MHGRQLRRWAWIASISTHYKAEQLSPHLRLTPHCCLKPISPSLLGMKWQGSIVKWSYNWKLVWNWDVTNREWLMWLNPVSSKTAIYTEHWHGNSSSTHQPKILSLVCNPFKVDKFKDGSLVGRLIQTQMILVRRPGKGAKQVSSDVDCT